MSEEMKNIVPSEGTPLITIKKLLEAGVHFGHQTKRWCPKMAPYIYTSRNGVYIFDLQTTASKIEEAYKAVKEITANGGKMLFVGTKQQVREVVKEEALRSGSFFVTQRWLGGTLTNFKTIQRRIKRLKDLEMMEEDKQFENYTKKEVATFKKEQEKLEKYFNGIKEMRRLPQAIFVIDPRIERNAVLEAKKLGIPVFGIVDTNCDPDDVNYVIPANDDAVRGVKLILAVINDAIVEAKGGQPVVAYEKGEGEDLSMTDAIKEVDRYAEQKAQQQQRRKEESAKNNNWKNNQNRNDRNVGGRGPRPMSTTKVVSGEKE